MQAFATARPRNGCGFLPAPGRIASRFFGANLLGLSFAVAAQAATIVVAPNGSGDASTIQAAVGMSSTGDVIALLDGTFTGPGNRDIDLMGKAITIRSQSGVATSCVIDCGGSPGEPHRGFVFESGEGAGTILQDIRIESGLAWDGGGGAMRCAGSSPTLRRVQFADSSAGFGGGLACVDGAAPTIEDCTFTGNHADFGSGAACHAASPRFINCRFVDNLTAEIGGGLLCEWQSHPTLEDCTFEGNRAEIGGGLACRDDSNPTLSRCKIARNVADAGGAEGGGAWCANSSPTFTECVFEANEAAGHGGALVCVFASPRLVRCTLFANRSPVGAGLFAWLDSAPVVESSIIALSPEGAAVVCEAAGVASLTCCDVWGNAGGDWTDGIAGQLADTTNFSADPRFCEAPAGILHLWNGSPCLPGNHPNDESCGTIGAFGQGCTVVRVESTSWSTLKQLYRDRSASW